ncbi:TPA: hypothetical protein QCI16_005081 [Enterobacter ludwigii]|nr:hypothetical protein [Enterobacter ludwigii]HDR2600827.1 hypothetical protein [Enterobacter ludwigii]
MKAIFKVTAVAALMAAGMSSAFAAGTDAHVEITGNVTPVSCNLGPGAKAPTAVFLGNASQADFTAGTSAYLNLFTVPSTKKTITVSVDGCSGVTPKSGDTLNIKINANGNTLNNDETLFGGGPGQVSNAGATLIVQGGASLQADNSSVIAYTYNASEPASAADGSTVVFETMMAAQSNSPSPGGIDAPITFTVDYK